MSRAFLMLITHLRSAVGILFIIPFTVACSIVTMTTGLLGLKDLSTVLVRGWGNVVLFVFGIKVAYRNEEYLPAKGGGILVFNHQSLFDIPIILATTRKHIRFGAKIELFKIPFFGRAIRAIGTLPIARENRSEVLRIYKDAEARFREDYVFALAPEGTRQKEPAIGRFKKGPFVFAINGGVPVIPVVIKGAHSVLPKKSLLINVGRWSRTVAVEYLTPFETKGMKTEELQGLVDKVHKAFVDSYSKLEVEA